METSSQLTNESLDEIRIIESKEKFRIRQLKACDSLEKIYTEYQDGKLSFASIDQKLISLSKFEPSLKPKDHTVIFGNWTTYRKNLLVKYLQLNREKFILKRILPTREILEENLQGLIIYLGLDSSIYNYDSIDKWIIKDENPVFESDDKASLNTFEDDNSLLDPLEFELEKARSSRTLVVTNISGNNNTVNNHITINKYFSASRETLNSLFEEGNKTLTDADRAKIKELSKQQKRREGNVKFLIKEVRVFKSTPGDKEAIILFRKAYKSDPYIKQKKKLIKVFENINVDNQIRALIRDWSMKETKIIGIRTGKFNGALLNHRYTKVFTKILGDEFTQYNIMDIYGEATSGFPANGVKKIEQVNLTAFRSIPDLGCFDDGSNAIVQFTDAPDEASTIASYTDSYQLDNHVDHLRDLNLYDIPKPSSKLQRFRAELRSGECAIL